ncbi:MAG TPA: patatin-like phospholipase family protein [Allocoleopsis sp.]
MSFTKLVLSGGSIKGICYLGFMKYMEEKDILKNINEIVGCSIGSLAGLLIILGYTSDELKEIFFGVNFDKIKSIKIGNFICKYGLDTGEKLEKLIKIFIKNKNFDDNITLTELYKKTGKKLITTVTNVNTKSAEFLHHDIPVYLAVRMSMNIPLLFCPVKYNGFYYVDGGLCCNFPIRYYSPEILKDSKEDILCVVLKGESDKKEINDVESYMYNIVKTAFHKISTLDVSYALESKISLIMINTNIKSSFSFEMSEETKNELYFSGYNKTKDFFDNK